MKFLFLSVNWNAVDVIATAATGIVILISVILVVRQIKELRRATNSQAFASLLSTIQAEEERQCRRTLFGLSEKEVSNWSDEEKSKAERVCQSYNNVAIMVRYGILPKEIVLDNWRTPS